jgi:hypothetical protein
VNTFARLAGCFFLLLFGYTLPQNVAGGHTFLILVNTVGVACWVIVLALAPHEGFPK